VKLVDRVDAFTRAAVDVAPLDSGDVDAHTTPELLLCDPADCRLFKDSAPGRASMFEGDVARDRQFLEHVLEGIYVYQDGTVVLRFKEESLFAPVKGYEFTPGRAGEGDLEAGRCLHGRLRDQAEELAALFPGGDFRVPEEDGFHFDLTALRNPPMKVFKNNVSDPTGIFTVVKPVWPVLLQVAA
jgi:hypothetical protein